MKYARKVNFTPDLFYINKAKVVLGEHAKSSEDAQPVLTRYYIPEKQQNLIKKALPNKLQDTTIFICRTTIDLSNFENDLKPHVHTDEKCVLNYYLTTSGEETSFFEGDIIPDDEIAIDNGNLYYMVKTDKLTKVESFTSSKGDAWLLSTRQPHQVFSKTEQHQVRDIVQIYFMDLSFDEVSKHFEVI